MENFKIDEEFVQRAYNRLLLEEEIKAALIELKGNIEIKSEEYKDIIEPLARYILEAGKYYGVYEMSKFIGSVAARLINKTKRK